MGRIAIELLGISPAHLRLPAALVNGASLVLVGLLTRTLGGGRAAQCLALLATFPIALAFSSVLQYNTTDLFAWSLTILSTARVLRSGDPRNWIGAGAGIGLGVLSKYSIAFPAVSLVVGLLLLPAQRHHVRSRWFWYGAATATILAAPNLLWLATHHFITLQMEHFIHLRDIRLGRAEGYYSDQLRYTFLAFPLAVAGLVSLLRSPRFRLLSAFFLGPFLLIAAAKGRGYYLLPAYPVLYAAGAIALERVLAHRGKLPRNIIRTVVAAAMLANSVAIAWTYLPIWPPGSSGWTWQMDHNQDMADEVGWPEFVAQVAAVRDTLPAADRARLGVLANNYGEAGALALYGPAYHLPTPISSTNSFHARGWGAFDPETVIVTGGTLEDQLYNFDQCSVAATIHAPYGVRNEEAVRHPDILVCHHLRRPWAEVWAHSQEFG
ncbi:glycosyltransferase family 39 protein [Acidipila sp. EB88]|uniref:ArnT family glycosyltransferase n=1 Tax=Acidipila sp. EB88 TaxID=2305226 RepID=UPI001315605B|nr:glycosyltransferase family 39 protein [Acidipila sp. EB88]